MASNTPHSRHFSFLLPPSRSFVAVVLLAVVASSAAAFHQAEVILTDAVLFAGLDGACTPNETNACESNVVNAIAWCRSIGNAGTPFVFFPTLDRLHILTKLHPLDWGANFALHTRLGVARAFMSRMSFPQAPTMATYSARERDPKILDNLEFPAGHNLHAMTTSRLIDERAALHIVAVRRRFESLDAVAKTAATTMLWSDLFSKTDRYKNTLALVSDGTPEEFMSAFLKHGARPEIICAIYATKDSVEFKNGTWLLHVKTTKSHLHRIAIHRASNTSSEIVNVTLTAQPLELPPAMRTDPQYVADRAMMKAEALIAAANNPVQGSTAGPMPPSTLADGAAICRRGECAMGNLWADSLREIVGTDIALFSGTWIKGRGWAAGNVSLRDVYDSYGFIELASKVTVLGLSLFELWNHSLALSAFDPYLPTANTGSRHLPQVSGMRVRYNLARADVNNRLISIEVWNSAAKEYRPLERLKLYTVCGPQFLVEYSNVHSKHLSAAYKGEVSAVPINQDVQTLLRQYIVKTAGTYVPGIYGRMVEDNTSSATMQAWNHQLSGCRQNHVLDTTINTCVVCPPGTTRAKSATICTPVVSDELSGTAVIGIVAGVCVFALLCGVALGIGALRWRRHVRIRHCPKNPQEDITAFFVTVRNEVAVRERFPDTAHAAFKRIEEAVSRAAVDHHCFVARRLGAHFLIVSSNAANAIRAASDIQCVVHHLTWSDVLIDDTEKKPSRSEGRKLSGSALSPDRTTPLHRTPASDHVIQTPSDASARSGSCKLSARSHNSTRLFTREIVPVVSAGLAFGRALIDYDGEFDTWDFNGAVVDAAASVADAARPGQFLLTQTVLDTAARNVDDTSVSLGATFDMTISRRVILKDQSTPLLQLDADGCPHRRYEDLSSSEPDTAGALTAALEVAAGRLTSRPIGAVCWSVPALRSASSYDTRADHAKALEASLTVIQRVCDEAHANIIGWVDDGAQDPSGVGRPHAPPFRILRAGDTMNMTESTILFR